MVFHYSGKVFFMQEIDLWEKKETKIDKLSKFMYSDTMPDPNILLTELGKRPPISEGERRRKVLGFTMPPERHDELVKELKDAGAELSWYKVRQTGARFTPADIPPPPNNSARTLEPVRAFVYFVNGTRTVAIRGADGMERVVNQEPDKDGRYPSERVDKVLSLAYDLVSQHPDDPRVLITEQRVVGNTAGLNDNWLIGHQRDVAEATLYHGGSPTIGFGQVGSLYNATHGEFNGADTVGFGREVVRNVKADDTELEYDEASVFSPASPYVVIDAFGIDSPIDSTTPSTPDTGALAMAA